MIGNLPQGVFGLGQMASTSAPLQQPREPFVYGPGGARMSPEDLAMQRRRAQQLQAAGMDFSPVDHWTQGLARVAQGLVGSLQDRSLEQQQAENAAARNADIAMLLGEKGADLAPALTSNDPVVAALAESEWARRNPKPVNNDTVADYNFWQSVLPPEDFATWRQNKINPPVYRQGADGQFYRVDTSPTAQASSPKAPVGKLTPIEPQGGPQSSAAGGF